MRAVRSTGWDVPIFSATSAEGPLVRQQLSDHPEWLDGLTFASSRLTSEKGPDPFNRFRQAYEKTREAIAVRRARLQADADVAPDGAPAPSGAATTPAE